MQFRIGFQDLRELRHQGARFTQSITVETAPGGALVLERSARGVKLTKVITAQLAHYGSNMVPCAGPTSHVNTASDTVLVSVPVRCATTSRRPVRFHVSSTAGRVFTEASGRSSRDIGNDQLYTARPLLTR
jgi:hypothetical protein